MLYGHVYMCINKKICTLELPNIRQIKEVYRRLVGGAAVKLCRLIKIVC